MFLIIAVALIAVWIYLVRMVRKKETGIFDDQMEPKLAERRLKRLKTFLRVAGISFVVGFVGFIVANILDSLFEIQVPVVVDYIVDYILIAVFLVFVIGTIGGLVIFLQGRQKTT